MAGGRTRVRGISRPLASTVDVATATYRNDIGATELSASWTDPEFDPTLACAYYARTLEIATPRWSTYDAVKHGLPIPTAVPAAVQQRAWTSPIWYTPSDQDRAERPVVEGMFTVAPARRPGHRADDRRADPGCYRGPDRPVGEPRHRVRSVIHYDADGNRSLMGLGDRPVVTPYEIRDGRRIETSLLG